MSLPLRFLPALLGWCRVGAPSSLTVIPDLRPERGRHHRPRDDRRQALPGVHREMLLNTIGSSQATRPSPKCMADLMDCVDYLTPLASGPAHRPGDAGTHPLRAQADQRYAQLVACTAYWGLRCSVRRPRPRRRRGPARVLPIQAALTAHLGHQQAISASSPFWAGEDTGYASIARWCSTAAHRRYPAPVRPWGREALHGRHDPHGRHRGNSTGRFASATARSRTGCIDATDATGSAFSQPSPTSSSIPAPIRRGRPYPSYRTGSSPKTSGAHPLRHGRGLIVSRDSATTSARIVARLKEELAPWPRTWDARASSRALRRSWRSARPERQRRRGGRPPGQGLDAVVDLIRRNERWTPPRPRRIRDS